MTTTYTPCSASRARKQVCQACRARKKRCDGNKPRCDSCQKWDQPCHYLSRPQTPRRALGLTTPPLMSPVSHGHSNSLSWDSPAFDQLLRLHDGAGPVSDELFSDPMDTAGVGSDGLYSFLSATGTTCHWPPVSASTCFLGSTTSTASASTTDSEAPSSVGLPARNKVLDVVDLFFLNFHALVPCLQESTFRATCYREDSPLLFAVLAIAAGLHTDPVIQCQEQEWYDHARTLYSQTVKEASSIEPLQTACLIAFQGLVTGDLEAVWTLLGDAWRKACALGLNRLDAPDALNPPSFLKSNSPKEKEEHRMVFWTLFLLDRLASFPCGLPYAIDDRYVRVNLPLQSPAFVYSTFSTPEPEPTIPFTRDLQGLVLAKPSNSHTPVPIIHHVVKAYILLGRIIEHIYALHPATDSADNEAAELDNALIYFRLNLPRSATHLSSTAPSDLKHVVWLTVIMHANTILLHFWQFASQSQSKSFDFCVVAATAIVSLIKEACRIDPSLLVNMHLLPAFYLSSRILLIHGRGCQSSTKLFDSEVPPNQNWRSDMNLLLMVFRMVGGTHKTLATKFEKGVLQDLELSDEGVQQICKAGARGLLLHCCSWHKTEGL